MSETVVKEVYDANRKRRVLIVQRSNGTFGYEEEPFSDEPLELCWRRFSQVPFSVCDSAEGALKEAQGRVKWLCA
jgi:hypothetical protein